jgi:hypothetical protein
VVAGVSVPLVCDVEGHLVRSHSAAHRGTLTWCCAQGADGRYYILDTARVLPPCPPQRGAGGMRHLFQLFRREFMADCPFPLSADAFSAMGAVDGAVHNGTRCA